MEQITKIGIIICDRYRTCAGGKCLRSLRNREGAFSIYAGQAVELVGYTTCNGCPGGNIEYAGDEMVRNGAQVIHLATGLLVGYPLALILLHLKPFGTSIRHPGCFGNSTNSPKVPGYEHQTAHLGRATRKDWLSATMADEATEKHITKNHYDCFWSCPIQKVVIQPGDKSHSPKTLPIFLCVQVAG